MPEVTAEARWKIACINWTHADAPHAMSYLLDTWSEAVARVSDLVSEAPDARIGREPACVARWPECDSFGYDPRCCRFPKSCSVQLVLIPRVAEDA